MIDNPVEIHVRTATATIDSSLFQAAGAADMSDTVALKLAGIFGWDIDFVLDIREGDRFTVDVPADLSSRTVSARRGSSGGGIRE